MDNSRLSGMVVVAQMNGGSEIVEDSHAVGRVRHELTKLE